MLEFVSPEWFWSLLILIPYLAWELFFKKKQQVHMPHSRLASLRQAAGHSSWLRWLPLFIRLLLITLIIFALARPRLAHQQQ